MTRTDNHPFRTLTLVTAGLGFPSREELEQLEKADLHPRSNLFPDTLHSDILDERALGKVPEPSNTFYRRIPVYAGQAIEAFRRRKQYDAIISWAAQIGIPLAAMLKLAGEKRPHVILDNWISKPKKGLPLRLLQSHISRLILWSTVQRDYAVNTLRIPDPKIAFIRWFVDQKFFRPSDQIPDQMICAAGSEMRDYPTLIEALRSTNFRCHIATGKTRKRNIDSIEAIDDCGHIPDFISVGPMNYAELRSLYARSQFVVIPLKPSDTDNGLTCMLESMAMGKAVICTRTKGQIDVLKEGKTGLYVEPNNPRALREAIQFLWERPEIASEMGAAGRREIEEYYTIDQFVENVKSIVLDVVRENAEHRIPEVPRRLSEFYGARAESL